MSLAHLRTALRLGNALHAAGVEHAARVRYLLATLCKLLDAPVGAAWLARDLLPDRSLRVVDVVDHGFATAGDAQTYRAYLRRAPAHPFEPLLRGVRFPTVITRSRDQLMNDDVWYRLPHVLKLCRAARLDNCIYSGTALPRPGWVGVIEVYRAWGDARRFTKKDRRLMRLVHGEITWLDERNPVYQHAIAATPLSPRLRTILDLLLRGLSEKEMAERLTLSYHTVHTQVGLVYHRFGVHSRAELLARHLAAEAAPLPGPAMPELSDERSGNAPGAAGADGESDGSDDEVAALAVRQTSRRPDRRRSRAAQG